MRVLFFSSVYPHPADAVRGTYNWELCQALAQEHEVRVVAPRPWLRSFPTGPANWDAAKPDQCDSVDVTYPPYFHTPKMLRHLYGSFMWMSVRDHLRRVAEEFTPDCVVSYWAHPDGEVGLCLARERKVPAIVIVGGSDVLVLTRNRKRGRCVRNVLRGSDAVVTVSEGLRERVIELGGDPDRVHAIQQGVDEEVFRPGDQREARRIVGIPRDRTVLVWVGRMVPVKGLEVLMEAFQQFATQRENVHLYLLGDGPLRFAVREHAEAAGLSSRVHCVGPVPHHKLPDWYRAADATVLSSWSEGLPNVLRESLACGTPFACTDVGSVSEIAVPGCSMLAPSGNALRLAEAMDRVTTESYREAAQGYRARRWSDTAKDLVRVVERLTSDRPGSDVSEDRLPVLAGTP